MKLTIKWKSLTTLTTLFYFTTVKMKFLTTLTTLFQFTITKAKYLTTLTTVFLFSLLLKLILWLHSLRCFTSLLLSLLLSLIHQIVFPWEIQYFHKICMCHSNFTARRFSGVLHALLPKYLLVFFSFLKLKISMKLQKMLQFDLGNSRSN